MLTWLKCSQNADFGLNYRADLIESSVFMRAWDLKLTTVVMFTLKIVRTRMNCY